MKAIWLNAPPTTIFLLQSEDNTKKKKRCMSLSSYQWWWQIPPKTALDHPYCHYSKVLSTLDHSHQDRYQSLCCTCHCLYTVHTAVDTRCRTDQLSILRQKQTFLFCNICTYKHNIKMCSVIHTTAINSGLAIFHVKNKWKREGEGEKRKKGRQADKQSVRQKASQTKNKTKRKGGE